MIETDSMNGAQQELPKWEGFLTDLFFFQNLKSISIKGSEVTDLKKTFLCCRRDGGDLNCNYFGVVFSGNRGQILWSPAAAIGPTELLLQPTSFLWRTHRGDGPRLCFGCQAD